tara:strand:+ start:3294 stop:3701 length:408 start_codon:yes stop_codon:yes gene_type:complete
MSAFSQLKNITESLPLQEKLMPALFIGHGNPMNGVIDNEFSRSWKNMVKDIPKPNLILCVSAHWLTRGTSITAMSKPKTIHDFGGFPKEMYEVQYPAPGHPGFANELHESNPEIKLDQDWGLDHGSWTVIRQMYP